jgi:hypothetical protein
MYELAFAFKNGQRRFEGKAAVRLTIKIQGGQLAITSLPQEFWNAHRNRGISLYLKDRSYYPRIQRGEQNASPAKLLVKPMFLMGPI